jgi:hypothetical protein
MMRVIRNGTGWDIALDIVFKEKQTALEVARRMEHGVYALLRAAMDESMRPSASGTNVESEGNELERRPKDPTRRGRKTPASLFVP